MSSVQQNVIKHKVGLLNLAAELGNVSRACKVMGLSRDTFYHYQLAVESGGVDALIDAVDSFSWTLNILILRSPQCPRHVRPIRLNFAIR